MKLGGLVNIQHHQIVINSNLNLLDIPNHGSGSDYRQVLQGNFILNINTT